MKMTTTLRSTGLKLFGAIGLIFLTTLAYADEHAYKPSGQGAVQPLKQGEKWQTDEVLRLGMDNIHKIITANQDAIEKERLSGKDYQGLAKEIDKNIADIVKTCKLSKEADSAFHTIVLADLTGGTELMRASPKVQAQRVGALGVLQALRNYGEYFQHPGWSLGAAKTR
jgi:hypothetical protein